MLKIIHSERAPKAVGPYSQAILSDDLLFCSGQIALDPNTTEMLDGDVSEQTVRVCENIAAVLGAEGLCFDDVVKTTVFITNMDDFSTVNNIYEKYFVSKPARSCVEVSALPKGAKVEIEVIAKK